MMKQCKKCGSENLYLEPRVKEQDVMTANMVALKCKDCGTWLKWCPKDERHKYIHKESIWGKYTKSEIESIVIEHEGSLEAIKQFGELEDILKKYKIETIQELDARLQSENQCSTDLVNLQPNIENLQRQLAVKERI